MAKRKNTKKKVAKRVNVSTKVIPDNKEFANPFPDVKFDVVIAHTPEQKKWAEKIGAHVLYVPDYFNANDIGN